MRHEFPKKLAAAALLAAVLVTPGRTPRASGGAADLLPDIIPLQSALYEHEITTTIIPGHTHLRLSQITANIGDGKLYFWGGPNNGDGTQDVYQRVFRDDDTYYDRLAGLFVYHPGHGHTHFDGWAIYRLREILPGDGVGEIVASGQKTSFCVFDNVLYDPTLPNYTGQEFVYCSTSVQGLGIGWGDSYDLYTEGQNIDITGVPPGEYWLESEVDPDNTILELDDTNNIARIKVTIGSPGSINPDPYEPNQNAADLVGRPVGGLNSPVLGPTGPTTLINNLTIHDGSVGEDWYEIYLPAVSGPGDRIRIDFNNDICDLRLRLRDASQTTLATSNSSDTYIFYEQISLQGYGPGWFYIEVDAVNPSATSPGYSLLIEPPANSPPSVDVLTPPAGDVELVQAVETYQVTWNASDPEGNETWVSVYLNTSPVLDGNEFLHFSSLNTPGSQGFHVLDTVGIPYGTYYVYCSITDGGSVSGEWADGTVTIVSPATGIGDTPVRYVALLPNVPNPFNPTTLMTVNLLKESFVSWRIYNVGGQLVRTIESRVLSQGLHRRTWDGRNDQGELVSSGVYIGVLETPDVTDMQKLVFLK